MIHWNLEKKLQDSLLKNNSANFKTLWVRLIPMNGNEDNISQIKIF